MHAPLQIDGSPGDVELVRQVMAGSEAALAALYDRYAATVFRTALRLKRDHGLAEDVVQETFLSLWNRAEQFDPTRGSLGGWLAAIARNRAIDRSRAEARRIAAQPFSVVAADQPDEVATVEWLLASGTMIGTGAPERQPDDLVAAGETMAVIDGAVADLTDEERQAILLAYRDGLSQSEIAARLGWPIGTVKTRSRRALRRLRERLEPAAGTDEPLAAAAGRPVRAGRTAPGSATAGCAACP